MNIREDRVLFMANKFSKTNYLEREARNSSLGAAGEEFVLKYEKTRLESFKKLNLVDRIEQISETQGDWAGYDIFVDEWHIMYLEESDGTSEKPTFAFEVVGACYH